MPNDEQSIFFTSVVDDQIDNAGEYDAPERSRQGYLMRLGASINLDSHITVSRHTLTVLQYHF